nr:PREDICTED: THAP domain-containing protein 10-like [Notothenia coriiceps]
MSRNRPLAKLLSYRNNLMLVKRCGHVVQFCGNSSLSGHSVHEFPKHTAVRRQWIRFVQTKRANFHPPHEKSQAVICGSHLTPDSFEGALMVELGYKTKKTLKLDAVPTINPEKPAETPKASGAKRSRSAACSGNDCQQC